MDIKDKPIVYPVFSDLPQDVLNQLADVIRNKIPGVDEAIVNDIIITHKQIVKDYLVSQMK